MNEIANVLQPGLEICSGLVCARRDFQVWLHEQALLAET